VQEEENWGDCINAILLFGRQLTWQSESSRARFQDMLVVDNSSQSGCPSEFPNRAELPTEAPPVGVVLQRRSSDAGLATLSPWLSFFFK
jgi:hypothetical protein